jgi:hypothetical protein
MMRYQLTSPKRLLTSVREDMEKLGPLNTVDGNAKWCRCNQKHSGELLKN